MTSEAPPELHHRFRIIAEVGGYLPLQQRDTELLEYIPITGGTVTGDLTGGILPGGADWCLSRADDAYDVEARYLFRTDHDEIVDVVNVGVLRHLPGAEGDSKDMGYFLTTPRFRTAAPRLLWLTRSVFVGRAVTTTAHTAIDVYEVGA